MTLLVTNYTSRYCKIILIKFFFTRKCLKIIMRNFLGLNDLGLYIVSTQLKRSLFKLQMYLLKPMNLDSKHPKNDFILLYLL